MGKGDMYIMVPKGETKTKVLLRDVLYAPAMSATLISISKIAVAKHTVTFRNSILEIYDPAGKQIGEIRCSNGLYSVNHGPCDEDGKVLTAVSISIDSLHRRMGHIAPEAARDLVRKGLVLGVELEDEGPPIPCESCEYAKATRKPIRKVRMEPRANAFGDEVYSDLWGPSPVQSIGGRKYYVTYMDGCTRWTIIDVLRTKDEALSSY